MNQISFRDDLGFPLRDREDDSDIAFFPWMERGLLSLHESYSCKPKQPVVAS
ncbi:hypothetical protein [Halocatena marina]|uniref:Uncharacterized protein n=1 Tax=Halocatena marina TaxID=2934937 RepID=A0ABD5YQU8_9EURY|nr:hypothetical protein [Halocatena marina]